MFSRYRFAAFLLFLAFSSSIFGQQAPAPKTTVSPSVQERATADLDSLVKGFQYEELAQAVAAMPPSADRDYFAGVLANRQGRVAESISLLAKTLPQLRTSAPNRAAVALLALGDDYIKTYRYNDAIAAYDELLRKFVSYLDKAERQSTEDDYKTVRLLKDAPPQTISFDGPVDVPTHRNGTLGTIDATLSVNGVTDSWILDTGANFTAVTVSFAKRLGVSVSKGNAQTQGITGAENTLRIGILPELKVGGATVHNVVLLVLDDSSLNVQTGEKSRYQINAVLGYPVLHALERITFTNYGHFLAGPASPSAATGARLYMKQLTPLLECAVEGRKVLFSFDTGANSTFYSVRYGREFPKQLSGIPKRVYGLGGAGGVKRMDAYYLPHPQLGIGSTTAELQNVPVLAAIGTDTDKLFGNLGRDLTDPYRSFTIDFANMQFQLGEKLSAR